MPEVSYTGQGHCHTKPVRGLDNLGVTDRPPRLNNGRCTSLGNGFKAIGKGKKGVGGSHCALEGEDGLHRPKPRRINPAHLTGANADRLAMAIAEPSVDDRV